MCLLFYYFDDLFGNIHTRSIVGERSGGNVNHHTNAILLGPLADGLANLLGVGFEEFLLLLGDDTLGTKDLLLILGDFLLIVEDGLLSGLLSANDKPLLATI